MRPSAYYIRQRAGHSVVYQRIAGRTDKPISKELSRSNALVKLKRLKATEQD